jgi:hypothetical protein
LVPEGLKELQLWHGYRGSNQYGFYESILMSQMLIEILQRSKEKDVVANLSSR